MVSEIETIKQQISQAKNLAIEKRKQLVQRREDAKKAETLLKKQESKLPIPSQRRLRQGLYAGLEGRKRRRIIFDIKKEIGQKKGEVDLFKESLTEFEEKQLEPFESQISSKETEILQYEKDISDYKRGMIKALDQKPLGDANKMTRRGYYDFIDSQAKYEAGLKELSESEIQSPQGFVGDFPNQSNINLPRMVLAPPRDLGRTDILKDFSPITGFTISPDSGKKQFGVPIVKFSERAAKTGGFVSISDPFVFQKELSPINLPRIKSQARIKMFPLNISDLNLSLNSSPEQMDKNLSSRNISDMKFLTTGSPKRFTSILKLKPSRPPTPSKPLGRKVSIKKKSKKTKISKKDVGNLIFGKNKTKKAKNNIWEF